ncbi:hypothetical protein AGMMS49975_00730 [Clostridia bacterium]|nr:hypothetical protein AGMMS49975_00730 [Clostridia bacterium]
MCRVFSIPNILIPNIELTAILCYYLSGRYDGRWKYEKRVSDFGDDYVTKKKKRHGNRGGRVHGHYCRVCGEFEANEKFSGKGHALTFAAPAKHCRKNAVTSLKT